MAVNSEDANRFVSLDKFAKFIENNLHLDSESGNYLFDEAIRNMNNSEGFFQSSGKKLSLKRIEDGLDPMTLKLKEITETYEAEMREINPRLVVHAASGYPRKENERIKQKGDIILQRLYTSLGNLMQEYGILNILIHRSNAVFTKFGAPFLNCDINMVMEEFKRPIADPLPIMATKVSFYINKIVKYFDSVAYGDLLEDDKMKYTGHSDSRLKYLSKLKTDYALKLMEIMLCYESSDEQYKIIQNRKSEYEKLFGEYFKNLDLEADIRKLHSYEYRKQLFYNFKTDMVQHSVISLCTSKELRTREFKAYKALKEWGICRDKKGVLLLGMNLAKYPMPITMHLPQSYFNDIFSTANDVIRSGFYQPTLLVPEYHSLTGPKGIFPTNVLFQATENQKQKLEEAYKENPNNPYLKFFYYKIFPQKDKTQIDLEYKPISDFMR